MFHSAAVSLAFSVWFHDIDTWDGYRPLLCRRSLSLGISAISLKFESGVGMLGGARGSSGVFVTASLKQVRPSVCPTTGDVNFDLSGGMSARLPHCKVTVFPICL